MTDEVFTQTGTPEIRNFLIKGSFEDSMLCEFITFHRGCVKDGVSEALLYIDSPGGSVSTYLSIQALMASDEVLYHTIALGSACSAACLLTAFGSFRWAIPETCFMFHDASSVAWGKQQEMRETIEWNEKWLKRVFDGFAKETKKPLSFWLDFAYSKHSGDLFFTSEEALEWGLIDYIGLPTIQKHAPCTVDLPTTIKKFHQMASDRDTRRDQDDKDLHPKKRVTKKVTKKVTGKPKKKVVKKAVKKKT